MLDHTGLVVSNFAKSKAFYEAALGPIGYSLKMELPLAVTGGRHVGGFGDSHSVDFWISEGEANKPPIHVAFRVQSRDLVSAFYEAALAGGGTDNGAPGPRPHYHADYFGAFVLDPDGHNIEVVCHMPA